jgi:hypothetical protein
MSGGDMWEHQREEWFVASARDARRARYATSRAHAPATTPHPLA